MQLKWKQLNLLMIAVSIVLTACAARPEPEVIEKIVTQQVTQQVTAVVERLITPTPLPAEEPAVGGNLVVAVANVDTLDAQMSFDSDAMAIIRLMGATLVAKAPDGQYVPWLATSWTASADRLTWDFTLRDDVKFHDGTPLTAKEYAWTINRLINPDTKSPQRGRLSAVTSAEAVADYTLRLNLSGPYPVLLEQLSNTGITQPLSPAAVEAQGDGYGRNPVGVGPYKLKQWKTGDRVVLERNPDYAWGVPFAKNQGAFYIETITFRIIPEYSTVVAGLEAGEIDQAIVQDTDVTRMYRIGTFQVIESLKQGTRPTVHFNVSAPPFDDINVRKAFNLAVDRVALIKLDALGNGIVQYGPLSPNIPGAWADASTVGYTFDLDQAKALLEKAGYTMGANSFYEKDGGTLKLVLKALPEKKRFSEAFKEQMAALGVDIEIQIIDPAVFGADLVGGNFQLFVSGYNATESDILYRWFHTSRPNALNIPKATDPVLDKLLDATRAAIDPNDHQAALVAAQKHIIEQSYEIYTYAGMNFVVISNRIKGAQSNPLDLLPFRVFLEDAYIETK